MRAICITLAALALAGAGPSFAQAEHAEHHAATAADPANPTHEQCKAVMGHKMDPVATHDHAAMKGAPTANPHLKPLSDADMEKMHAACAAKMAKPADAPKS